jgi:hypothetical protein
VIFVQALFFIAIFLALPLVRWNRGAIAGLRIEVATSSLVYFALVGIGFMLVEIPLMQRCAVVLGSPIHSISVTLATLLLATGCGSYLLSRRHPEGLPPSARGSHGVRRARGRVRPQRRLPPALRPRRGGAVRRASADRRGDRGAIRSRPRDFFPSGLARVARVHEDLLAWGWALNCGFGVLGSIAAITLAQGLGFSQVLLLGAVCYLIASLAYRRLV